VNQSSSQPGSKAKEGRRIKELKPLAHRKEGKHAKIGKARNSIEPFCVSGKYSGDSKKNSPTKKMKKSPNKVPEGKISRREEKKATVKTAQFPPRRREETGYRCTATEHKQGIGKR